ncbi:MAG: peptide chain release factor N(5)-glutamine methyltransferase [Oscillatoriophycideae cyanobacterium NC_groundwater_1537_Pr4_S-0.65um_50_18]|nr:peptide chain release factor N(5)-glutamine methyltransferase [Oscillatoriophycideae cyanobacterium NC_groundwater_1537_Pr4_S-0.65um_50_18]
MISGLALWQWRQQAQQQAIAAQVPIAEIDWLLQELASLDRLSLRLESFKNSPAIALPMSLDELSHLWEQRLSDRVPIQYLVGKTPWRNLSLQVSPAVLIPRPETELLIDLAVAAAQTADLQQGDWADLGTGSGAIAIGLAAALPQATLHAVDVSAAALAVAQQNARQNIPYHANLGGDRIQFYQGSWFEPLSHLQGQLCGVVSNPPYIPSILVPQLQPEVAQHEPHLALDGGKDGLDAIRTLVALAPDYLRSGGLCLLEMMAGQAEQVVNLLEAAAAYRDIQVHKDLAGLDRFALAYRR